MAFSAHKDPEMMEEVQDSPEFLAKSIDQLVTWIRESKHLVVFTGAGVSTSAGIPDFRGPDGVWTLKAQGKQRKGPTTSTLKAFPTVCHMSLVALQNRGILKYLISQNCDGLHKRSGILPDRISELHGNSNIEYCEACGQEYLRDFYAHRLGRGRDHYTGRHCVVPLPDGGSDGKGVCNGRLMESTIDFGQNLPERPLELAEQNSKKADLHIVFGSSLTVSPACNMPRTTAKRGGRLVIVNLQKTPLYDLATLNIRARCDEVMAAIMSKLQITVPRWVLKREIIFNCQANKRQCLLSVQGVDPAKRMLPHSVCQGVTFKLPGKSPVRVGKVESLGDKEPYRLSVKHDELKESKDETILPVNVILEWRGHYDEADINLEFPLHLGKNSTTRYMLGYTPSLQQWEMKTETVPQEEQKAWSPLMHSLMGTGLIEQEITSSEGDEKKTEKKKAPPPVPSKITNVLISDDDEEMKGEEKSEGKETSRSHPMALWSASAVVRDQKDQQLLYVFGGAPVAKSKEAAGISVYDIKKQAWQAARVDEAKLPFATQERWGHSATLCPEGSGVVYLIGGWDSRCQYGDVMRFDAKTNKLEKLETDWIAPRAGHSAVCMGENIFLFGGALCKGGPYIFYNDVQVFDTKKKSWKEFTVGPEKPAPRSQHSCLALGESYLVVLGGYTGGSVLDEVWALDIKTAKWGRLLITSDEKGPKGFAGLSKTDFRVRPASHTSALLRWQDGVASVLVVGFCGSTTSYLLTLRPALGTMEWKLLESPLSTAPTAHSYACFPKLEGDGVTVISFGGILNERGGEPGTGRSNSYLRSFDVV